jgi:hypothetical protein
MGIDQELPGPAWSGGKDWISQPHNAIGQEAHRQKKEG